MPFRTKAARIIESVRSTFWLTPAVIAISLLALSVVLQGISGSPQWLSTIMKVSVSSADGARLLIAAVATASMTVVGVLFSVTIVVLQQVSSQYTPRVIENFIRSWTSQIVLGIYIGTFGYCLLLLRAIRGGANVSGTNVPEVGVAVGIFLALVCLALLIIYIHHIVKSIQSNQILSDVARETIETLDNIQRDFDTFEKASAVPNVHKECEVLARDSGYLQGIRLSQLQKQFRDDHCHIEFTVLSGDYIHLGQTMARVLSLGELTDKKRESMYELFNIGTARTHSHDPLFGIKLMTDIALRALSPGINDPSTAIEAINEIGTVFLHFTTKCLDPGIIRLGNKSTARVQHISYERFLSACFDQVILSGRDFRDVLQSIQIVLSHGISQLEDRDPKVRPVLERIRFLEHELRKMERPQRPVNTYSSESMTRTLEI